MLSRPCGHVHGPQEPITLNSGDTKFLNASHAKVQNNFDGNRVVEIINSRRLEVVGTRAGHCEDLSLKFLEVVNRGSLSSAKHECGILQFDN